MKIFKEIYKKPICIFRWVFYIYYMYIKKFNESVNHNVLVCVDIQEEYADFFNFNTSIFIDFLNNNDNKIYYIYNGEEMGGPSIYKLYDWLIDNGLIESKLDNIIFHSKEYGFFRDYIDEYSDYGLLELIGFMINNNILDSRDIEYSTFENFESPNIREFLETTGSVYLDLILINFIKTLPSSFEICGGGENECLFEIEILCNFFKKKVIRNNNFIY